jgi:hypothetical protein
MTRPSRRWTVVALAILFAAGLARADWVVQVAAYAERENLVDGSARLKKAGFPVVTEEFTPRVGGPLTRLLVGPYLDRKAAEAMAARLKAAGWPGYVRRYFPPPAPPTAVAAAPAGASVPKTQPPPPPPPPPVAGPAPTPAPAPPEPSRTATEPAVPNAAAPQPPANAPAPDADVPVPPPSAAPALSLPSATSTSIGGGAEDFKLFGSYQLEGAYTTPSPAHGSKFKSLLEVGAAGAPAEGVRWKVSGRFWYDAIYDVTHFYSPRVADDARFFYDFRETYLDVSLGDFDIRAGRQQIVWGEVVGLFFADVVSARELREFLARDLDYIRIPQWALRLEWTKGDFHAEAIGIPYMTYDRIGVPGGDFYPSPPPPPPGSNQVILDERIPPHTLANGSYGARVSFLGGGFDTSLFYYDSVDVSPAFSRTIVPGLAPTFVYTPDHSRIRQAGFTVAKDLGAVVLKTEAVYTSGKRLPVTNPDDADGLVAQNLVDAVLSAEYPFAGGARVNVQLFARGIFDRNPTLFAAPGFDPGASVDVSAKAFDDRLEAEILGVTSFKDQGWMTRFHVLWSFNKSLRLGIGADAFGGPETGYFGRFKQSKRYIGEFRLIF